MAEKKREKSVDVLDRLFWTVQPPMGLVKGDYYRAENWFAPHFPGDKGYHGILEVVRRDGTLQMVEFNEINNPTYYIRRYQGVSKRLSDYGFLQATKERTAKSGVVLVNGLTHLEEQMVAENRLTGEFDLRLQQHQAVYAPTGRGDRGAAGQALRPGVLRPVPGGGARRHRALADRAGGGKDHLLRLRRDLCRPAGGD